MIPNNATATNSPKTMPLAYSPRILLVSTSFPLSSASTSGIFVKRLSDALHPLTRITVLTPDSCEYVSVRALYPVVAVRYAPRNWQRLTHLPGGLPVALRAQRLNWLLMPLLFGALFIATLLRGSKSDVIHANWSLTGLLCAVAGRITRTPAVVSLRGADVSDLSRSLMKRLICATTLRLATYVTTVSTDMREAIVTAFSQHADKVFFIPNGVSQELLDLPLQPHRTQPVRIVFIGSLIPRKRVIDLIHAVHALGEELTLTIVGDGPEHQSLMRLAMKLDIQNRVSFLGSSPPDAITKILGQHDALVLPSSAEGRPNVVVEAMAAGRAVIASALPGVTELIEDGRNGLLFPAGDVSGLRAALEQLAQDPSLCAKLGSNARTTILELGLDWHHCAQRYLALYAKARGD